MNITYELFIAPNFSEEVVKIVAKLLEQQGKVSPPFEEKAYRCKYICIGTDGELPVAIGAIKKKTESVFDKTKSACQHLKDSIDFELGYIFTSHAYRGRKIAEEIIAMLLNEAKSMHLMSTTEVEANPAMVRLLLKNEFVQTGKTWKSNISGLELGLFIKSTT